METKTKPAPVIERPTDPKELQRLINDTLWKACDSFRGAFDPSEYKNYVLTFMFLKYLSDVWRDTKEKLEEQYQDPELVARKLKRERFVLPPECTYEFLYQHRRDDNIGELIDKALTHIEDENQAKLENVFRGISFNSEKLGSTKDRNRRLENLISDFHNNILDFRPSVLGTKWDFIGNAYMYLIERFASDAGKKGGEFFTPHEVSVLLAKLLVPKAGARICDPTCGSGSLLITVAEEVKDAKGQPSNNFSLYGQDSNGDTWALCKLNMFLHGMDSARIEWGDTINNPRLIEGDHLMTFDIVVANPPFSLDKWGEERAAADAYKRFTRGVPPKSKGDFAFILHMVQTATEGTGKVGVVVPHGVLFRGAREQAIRKKLIEENLLEAVIGLPGNLFYGTTIPAAILLFNKAKTTKDVLFIEASREYQQEKRQNHLREQDIAKIVRTYQAFASEEKYATRATPAQLRENDFNLNITRYVDTFEEEAPVDLKAVQGRIDELEKELVKVKGEMAGYLKELGLD